MTLETAVRSAECWNQCKVLQVGVCLCLDAGFKKTWMKTCSVSSITSGLNFNWCFFLYSVSWCWFWKWLCHVGDIKEVSHMIVSCGGCCWFSCTKPTQHFPQFFLCFSFFCSSKQQRYRQKIIRVSSVLHKFYSGCFPNISPKPPSWRFLLL